MNIDSGMGPGEKKFDFWFLTANDGQGSGACLSIKALRNRIDVGVQAISFNFRFLNDLLVRIEKNVRPDEAARKSYRYLFCVTSSQTTLFLYPAPVSTQRSGGGKACGKTVRPDSPL